MPVNWDEYKPVAEPKQSSVDWSQFKPADSGGTDWSQFSPVESQTATNLAEEQLQTAQKAWGTLAVGTLAGAETTKREFQQATLSQASGSQLPPEMVAKAAQVAPQMHALETRRQVQAEALEKLPQFRAESAAISQKFDALMGLAGDDPTRRSNVANARRMAEDDLNARASAQGVPFAILNKGPGEGHILGEPVTREEMQSLFPNEPKLVRDVHGAANNVVSGLADMFQDPMVSAGIGTAKIAPQMAKAIGIAFGLQMVATAPEQAVKIYDAYKQGDRQEVFTGLGNLGVTAFLAPKLLQAGGMIESTPAEKIGDVATLWADEFKNRTRTGEAQAKALAATMPSESQTLAPLTTAETSKTTEVPNASSITSTERIPSPQVRPGVDEGAPLRQQGETAVPQTKVLAPQTEKAVKEIVQPEDVSSGVLEKPAEVPSPQVQTEEAAQPPPPPPAQPVGTEAGKAVEKTTPKPLTEKEVVDSAQEHPDRSIGSLLGTALDKSIPVYETIEEAAKAHPEARFHGLDVVQAERAINGKPIVSKGEKGGPTNVLLDDAPNAIQRQFGRVTVIVDESKLKPQSGPSRSSLEFKFGTAEIESIPSDAIIGIALRKGDKFEAPTPEPPASQKPAPPAPTSEGRGKLIEKPLVEAGQGGVPYYRKLGEQDALDPSRKRKRAVPQNFKLAYLDGWYSAKKSQPTPPPTAGAGEKPIGMGGAVPEEFARSPQTPTGIKNATVDKERAARGLPPAVQPARRSFGKVWDEAMAKIDADPGYPDRLINELRDKPRALTDLEDATLLHRQIDLQNEYGKATRDLAQAFDDGRTADVDELKVRVAEWSDKLLDIYNVGKKVGTETGRGLAARKMMAYEDFSLAQMELAKRSAKGGGQLTDTERAEITKLHEKIADLQKRYDDLVAANEAKATVPGVDEAIDEAKAGQKRDKATGKTRTPTDIKGVAGRIRAKLKESENSEITSDLQKIVRQMVEENPKITRDQLVDQVNELFPEWSRRDTMDAISGYGDFKPLKKDEISVIVRDLKGQLQQIGKLEDMAAGQAPRKTGLERRTPTDEERRLIKQVEEAKRKGGYKVTDPETQLRTALQAVKTRLENQIKDLETQIQTRQKILKTKTALVYDDAANAFKARRDELKKQYDEIFPRPELTDAQRLERWKTRTTNRIQVLQERLANRDFAKRTQRPPPPLDAAAMDLQAQLFQAKQEFQRGLLEDRLAQRPWFERAQDTFLRWYRGGILSSPVVFGKLTAAAVMRAGLTPAEEAVGVGVSRAFPELAKRAPREGYWNSRAEANAIVKGLTRGVPDAWSILKTGESQLDVLYGKGREGAVGESQVRPFSIADLPGRTHGAWKATTKRAEFERAYEKIMAWYGRNGADTSNSGIQLQAAVEAYKHAQRSIFLQDNRLVSAFNSAINRLQQVEKSTGRTPVGGKLAATTARVLLPIVRVPSNIVAETFQFAFGSVTGPSRLIKAYAQGIEKLPPEQADLIMREIKKGSIGGVGLLLGYFMPQIWGGLYVPGEKQKSGQPKPGEAMLNGEIIPKWSLHHPFWETVQTGSTISRIMDDPKGGIGKAASASVLGLAEMNPLVKEMADVHKLFDPKQQTRYAAETLRSIIVPQGVQWAAKTFDTDVYGNKIERKPKDFIQHLNMGVPGLRETVPEMIGTPSSKKKR